MKTKLMTVPAIEGVPSRSRDVPFNNSQFQLRSSIITAHHSCNALTHDTGPMISEVWLSSDFLLCLQPTKISVWWHQLYNQAIFIELCKKYLPPAHSTQMADQYGLLPEDYVDDLKSMSIRRYSQGVLFLILSNNGRSLFKSLLLLWCYMILSITFLNKWVFPFLKDDSTYIFCLRSSISTGMFPIQWPTIVTDRGSGQNPMSSIFLSW